jgi:hypothetical protein
MMATFKCVQSGNTVTFTEQHDIDSMKTHGGYVLVEEAPAEPVKRVGRPRRTADSEGAQDETAQETTQP